MTDEKRFNEPKLAINRVYTRKGDAGQTSLVGGQKVSKDHLRIEAYGTLDELNAHIGGARVAIAAGHADHEGFRALDATLLRVQHELFNLGSVLATLPEDVVPQMPRVTSLEVEALERSIDEHNEALPALRSFVLPGGSSLNVWLHLARTVCRRAERHMVVLSRHEPVDEASMAYVNRLSDALFVWSRWASVTAGAPEVLWEPNKAGKV
jgi:cob(I)alamin adenosyltransferase